ncbi:hypothetical protein P3T40_005048 [Paraburkholderia sp. EB58]|jgi:hypothetical protein|uniref:hypothetical protein n=1 Tax=Paraburkholderia sp. EB58 TaxID=3035125 RepID=UPI003D23C0B8
MEHGAAAGALGAKEWKSGRAAGKRGLNRSSQVFTTTHAFGRVSGLGGKHGRMHGMTKAGGGIARQGVACTPGLRARRVTPDGFGPASTAGRAAKPPRR